MKKNNNAPATVRRLGGRQPNCDSDLHRIPSNDFLQWPDGTKLELVPVRHRRTLKTGLRLLIYSKDENFFLRLDLPTGKEVERFRVYVNARAALVREENTPKGIMAKREELKWLENAKNQLP